MVVHLMTLSGKVTICCLSATDAGHCSYALKYVSVLFIVIASYIVAVFHSIVVYLIVYSYH